MTPSWTWTAAFGKACGVLLQRIVDGLALTRISPNVLTFLGLVINTVAAILFGWANEHNFVRLFLYAGLVIIGAGIFDMVDGRVARQTHQVTIFGAFFDSVIDRYSDVVLFFGLLVFYARGNRFFYVGADRLCHGHVAHGQLHPGPCRGPDRLLQGGLHGAAGTRGPHHPGGPLQPLGRDGPGALGAGRVVYHHRHSSHQLYLSTHQTAACPAKTRGVTLGRPSPSGSHSHGRAVCRRRSVPRSPRLTMTQGSSPRSPVLLVHGGAWDIPADQLQAHNFGVIRAVDVGYALLSRGASALDAVEAAVTVLEDDETFDAGRGSFLTADGRVQLDALLMDGATLRAGAVACVERLKNPIQAARLVLERSPHVYLVGQGAEAFAQKNGLTLIDNAELVIDRERQRLQEAKARASAGIPDSTFAGDPTGSHDTVGAVALDADGNLAAATSTGGTRNKTPGRVGDSSVIGCGGYADNRSAAVSLTGWGEPIMKLVLGKWAVDRVPLLGPEQAAEDAIAYLHARLQGHGGIILLGPDGRFGIAHNTPRMAWAMCDQDGVRTGTHVADA